MLFNVAHRLLSVVKGPRLSIFIFHRVLPKHDPLMPGEPSIEEFDAIIRWIKKDFRIYTLGEALERFQRGPEGKPIAAITFDDGYADNFHHALPVLRQHGVAATFFIATGYLDGGRMWNDTIIESIRLVPLGELNLTPAGMDRYLLDDDNGRLNCIEKLINNIKYIDFQKRDELSKTIASVVNKELPINLMMTTKELISLDNFGMEIGAHTKYHPILSKLKHSNATQEIVSSKESLEFILKKPINLFAYPNGKPGRDYSHEHVEIVMKAGFKAAVSTTPGSAQPSDNIFELPRFTPWQREQTLFRLSSFKNKIQK